MNLNFKLILIQSLNLIKVTVFKSDKIHSRKNINLNVVTNQTLT